MTGDLPRRRLLKDVLLASVPLLAGGRKALSDTAGPRTISYGPGSMQIGDLHLPEGRGPFPVVVLLHGGFWRMPYAYGQLTKMGSSFAREGVAAWNVEYRRVGEPGGGYPGTFLDVAAAADHLKKLAASHPLDLSRVVSLGHSAGGHLAFWVAARHRIPEGDPLHTPKPLPFAGAVSLAGVVDLVRGFEENLGSGAVKDLIGGSPTLLPKVYAATSPAELLPLGVSQLLIHGKNDNIVPLSMSETTTVRAKEKGDDACFIPLEKTGHFEPIDPTGDAGRRVIEETVKLTRSAKKL